MVLGMGLTARRIQTKDAPEALHPLTSDGRAREHVSRSDPWDVNSFV